MKEFTSIDDILDFAINNEQNAVNFYTKLASESTNEEMIKVFSQFAKEEMGHKAFLTKVKNESTYTVRDKKILDLKMSDYMVDVKPSPNMPYEDALVLAMKREKNAFKLYMHLSERAPNDNLKKLFNSLAVEESKHKLRFELEYDEHVLREN
ncbi:MAG: rubrerythrin [Bacteroidetes bacterium 4484_276]|nr:MAG: rubrerythrin [Bacteroidetes bacterium 4484_276]OYT13896.1 MAG: rubrerythrin [Bacteroidetes bacterium 4572_114]